MDPSEKKPRDKLAWLPEMSTGIELIDQQHKLLFEKFNDFSETVHRVDSRLAAGEILDFLQFYAVWHFEQEEKEMEKYHCSYAEINKKAHRKFVETFGEFYTNWQLGTMTGELVEKTYRELADWLAVHVSMVDSKLLPFVENAGNP
jgi:hemerythrin